MKNSEMASTQRSIASVDDIAVAVTLFVMYDTKQRKVNAIVERICQLHVLSLARRCPNMLIFY